MGALRRIVLCADDYAMAPGVSSAIRTLIAKGRINATSVMVVAPEYAVEADALTAVPAPLPLQIGLHATLTGGFRPLVAAPWATPDGRFPALEAMLRPGTRFRIDRRAVQAEVEAQIECFRNAFGRTPDFVDGHQHVQLLPGVRAAFLAAVKRAAPRAWVRQCGPARLSLLLTADAKARVLAWWSAGFRARARRDGLSVNPAFAGAYDFDSGDDFGRLFESFLRFLPEGGVVMCHPGFVDAELRERDTLTDQREAEFVFLDSDRLPAALARANLTLAPVREGETAR